MSNTDTTENTEVVAYEKGTWQDTLHKSGVLFDRSAAGRKRASALLWEGGQAAINDWLPGSDTDAGAENMAAEVLDVLGKSRKGDVSKIKTVALAVKENGLVLASHDNLSKAYAEATRLRKTVAAEKDEDVAAEKAIEAIEVPKSTTTVDGAAAILLGKGIDGAVVAILDALGADNEAAHRAFMRAVSTEISARVQAKKPKAQPKAPAKAKKGAAPAKKATPTVKDGATKAKPKAKPAQVESSTNGDPNKRMLPPKAKPASERPAKAKPVVKRPARTQG